MPQSVAGPTLKTSGPFGRPVRKEPLIPIIPFLRPGPKERIPPWQGLLWFSGLGLGSVINSNMRLLSLTLVSTYPAPLYRESRPPSCFVGLLYSITNKMGIVRLQQKPEALKKAFKYRSPQCGSLIHCWYEMAYLIIWMKSLKTVPTL